MAPSSLRYSDRVEKSPDGTETRRLELEQSKRGRRSMSTMIIEGNDKRHFLPEMDQMYKLRKRVFHDERKWDVQIIRDWEIDGYDALDPLYVLSIEDGKVNGSLRLLPTTGPNMLNDTFAELLPEGRRFESPLIWESSRFCVDRNLMPRHGFLKLGIAMNEIGMQHGWTHIVTVYDAFMHAMLNRLKCAGDLLSPAETINGVVTYAVIYEIGRELEERLHSALPPDNAKWAIHNERMEFYWQDGR